MRQTVKGFKLRSIILLLTIACLGPLCLGSLAGCSSDHGTTAPATPDPTPTPHSDGKTPAFDQSQSSEADW